MKRVRMWVLVGMFPMLACRGLQEPGLQEPEFHKVTPATIQGTWTFDAKSWLVVKDACHQCHHSAPYPAGVQMHANGTQLIGQSIQNFFDGVADERAPLNRGLTATDKDILLRWAVSQGATWHVPVVPAAISWSMNAQIAGAAEGSDAAGPGKFFGFRVEDMARLDPSYFKIKSYTDRNGVTKKGIEFAELASVNPDSFASSTNPTSYVFIDGLAFGTRIREFTIRGFCTQSRWIFVGVHTAEMKKGPSPYGSRTQREYVRAQIDRDWVSVRGKRIPADGIETYPWGGQDPFLTAAPGQALNDNGFLNDDEWFMFTFTGKDLGSTFRYDLLLQRVNGSEVAHVAGDRTDGDGVHGGVFFGGYGKNSSTSKQDRFAEVTIEATCWGASKSPVRVVVD